MQIRAIAVSTELPGQLYRSRLVCGGWAVIVSTVRFGHEGRAPEAETVAMLEDGIITGDLLDRVTTVTFGQAGEQDAEFEHRALRDHRRVCLRVAEMLVDLSYVRSATMSKPLDF